MSKVNGLEVQPREGYFEIPSDWLVQKGDEVAAVFWDTRYDDLEKRKYPKEKIAKVAWLKVDETEIGKLKRYAGICVCRKCP